MNEQRELSVGPSSVYQTANDQYKRSYASYFWSSMIVATLLHALALAYWPDLVVADVSFTMGEIEAVDLPPEIEIPPAPEPVQRPANPVVAQVEIAEDITIAPTTFEDNRPDDLPPPRAEQPIEISDQPTFTPYTVAPELRNVAAVRRALEQEYPALLKDAGIGGTVVLHFFITELGEVENTLVAESSGYRALDDAALIVADVFQFSPALNRDQRVPVWIQIPVTFETRR